MLAVRLTRFRVFAREAVYRQNPTASTCSHNVGCAGVRALDPHRD